MGLLKPREAQRERRKRDRLKKALAGYLKRQDWLVRGASDPLAVLQAALAYLGGSRGRVVMINLEDLWGEKQPQNVPGTWREDPNWRRKARYALEEFRRHPHVLETLQRVNAARQGKKTR
jgi:4-alpha-glucanotransferase